MKKIVKDQRKRNRYNEILGDEDFEEITFKDELVRLNCYRLFVKVNEYLLANPKTKIKDDKIKEELVSLLKILLIEGMNYGFISNVFSNNITDKTLSKYIDKNNMYNIEDKNSRINNEVEVKREKINIKRQRYMIKEFNESNPVLSTLIIKREMQKNMTERIARSRNTDKKIKL